MGLADILQIFATLLAVILLLYSVMDFFSLAHQVRLKKERRKQFVSYLVLLMGGAFFFSLARLATFAAGYSTLALVLDTLAMASMVLAFYVHLRRTAEPYKRR